MIAAMLIANVSSLLFAPPLTFSVQRLAHPPRCHSSQTVTRMTDLHLIAATVQQLLSQTTALLQQNGSAILEDEFIESLGRDTRLAMMQLRRCRNDSIAVPINRLPPELLRMILGRLRHPPSTHSSRQLKASRFASYHPLTLAMLVCHKWHAIGSRAAFLWTDIDFARQGTFAPVLLTRSLGSLICLCGRLDGENMLETVIKDHGARIRELDVLVDKPFNTMPVRRLQSILSVDMPRVRLLSLSGEKYGVAQGSTVITDAPASFPALSAMLLENFLFVPAHALPQLTHLHLAGLDEVDPSSILHLLRNTPALEVFDIIECVEFTSPPGAAAPPSSVILPRLHSVYIWCLTSTTVHSLMTRFEAPNLACLRLSSIDARSGTLLSTPLIPGALATRAINRLALDLGSSLATFRTVFHGNDLSVTMDINAMRTTEEERSSWAFDDLPTILPLSCVEEFHFQVQLWGTAQGLRVLPHLAARMPMVSTLIIKYNAERDDEDTDGLMDLAWAVVALLESNNPVLFPHLTHLELIVSDIPPELCEHIAPALAQRDGDGRRLQKLHIRLDDRHWFRWAMKWMYQTEPDYRETGILDHVDSVKIGTKKSGRSADDDDSDRDESTHRLGWGEWTDGVQRVRHDYWQE
ncbi:hypothetical protein LXA43DRAFT_703815 [Ganoderma leucocontextum]|nr:hypothetical protein LXA43DRAFT_703815 [Ganoderma leucocontextum]